MKFLIYRLRDWYICFNAAYIPVLISGVFDSGKNIMQLRVSTSLNVGSVIGKQCSIKYI